MRKRQPRPARKKHRLKMIHLPVYQVHYLDLEKFICDVFGFKEFDYLMVTGAVSGMTFEYILRGHLSTDAMRINANRLRDGRRTRDINLILNTLVHDGLIPKGKYIVRTDKLPDPVVAYREILLRTGNPDAKECMQFKARQRDSEVRKRIETLESCARDQITSSSC
jgi:hypothetical protein